jgi:hypothetical protein
MLLLAGLANALYGIRQTSSPFDVVCGVPVDEPTEINIDQAVEAVPQRDESLAPISGESPDRLLQPAHAYEESDLPIGLVPDRLVIDSISLDAPIIPTKIKEIDYQGQPYYQWLAPDQPAVGWHDASAMLGSHGNTVLNGHHTYGKSSRI